MGDPADDLVGPIEDRQASVLGRCERANGVLEGLLGVRVGGAVQKRTGAQAVGGVGQRGLDVDRGHDAEQRPVGVDDRQRLGSFAREAR